MRSKIFKKSMPILMTLAMVISLLPSLTIFASAQTISLVQDASSANSTYIDTGYSVTTDNMASYLDKDGSGTTIVDYVGNVTWGGSYTDWVNQTALKFTLPATSSVLSTATLHLPIVDVKGTATATVTLTDDNSWQQTNVSTTSTYPSLVNATTLRSNQSITTSGDVALPLDAAELDSKIVPSGPTTITLILTGNTATDNYFNFVADDDASASQASLVLTFKPQVQSVSVPSNGIYKIGDALNFTVSFDSDVVVTGTPRIPVTLNTGGTVYASYVSGSASKNLVFRYTVASGNLDADGISLGSAIDLNSGSIKNSDGDDAELNLYSIAATTSVLVDGVVPTISVSHPSSNTYAKDANLEYTATFSEPVTVVTTGGIPYLTLTVGSSSKNAPYLSGSGTSVLKFGYTVKSGDTDTDGVALSSNVTLNGGTIKDAAGNEATLTFTGSTEAGVMVDGVSPTVTSVSVPSNDTYKIGDRLSFKVNFDKNVNVTGTPPQLPLTLNTGGTVYAYYDSEMSDSDSLDFEYFVVSGNLDLDGITLGSAISLISGTIKDDAGHNAILTLNSVASATGVLVDGVAPTVSISSTALNPTKTSPIPVTITFSEAVTGFDESDITVTNGTKGTLSGSGALYALDITPSGLGIVTVDIAAGVATDAAENTNKAATQFTSTFDNIGPTVGISSTALNPTKTSPISVTITFSEPVIGFDASDIAVTNGAKDTLSGSGMFYSINITPSGQGTVTVDIAGGVATDTAGNANTAATQLSFTFDSEAPTVSISSTALNPTKTSPIPVTITFSEEVSDFTEGDITVTNGAITATSFSGGATTYTANITPSGQGAVKVNVSVGAAHDAAGNGNTAATELSRTFDDIAPTVTSIVRLNPTNEKTNATNVTFRVTFSEAVTGLNEGDFVLTGSATGSINSVSSVSGSDSTKFDVVVNSVSGTGTLRLDLKSSGTGITDTALNAIIGGFTTGETYNVDLTAPAISSVSVPVGTYISGQNLDFTVTFSEAVTVSGGTPYITITMDTGGTVNANCVSGSGTTVLGFRYTVVPGNFDGTGIALGTQIKLNGATMKDGAGNDAAVAITPSTEDVKVDGAVPTASGVGFPANGTYIEGQNLDFTVTFSDSVTVDTLGGVPYIVVKIGSTNYRAYYQSGSPSTSLVFRYTLGSGLVDSNGIDVVSGITANGGTLKSGSGNNAALYFTTSTAPGVKVDAVVPTVTAVTVTDGTYKSGQDIVFSVTFSEAVTVVGAPYIDVTIGTTHVQAGYASGSGTTNLVFSYTLASGVEDADGIAVANAITPNLGTIKDAAGNNATLSYTAPTTTGVKVDSIVPAISSAALSADNTYIDITFSEGIYGVGASALTKDKLALTFTPNGGNATNAVINSIMKFSDPSQALAGGENKVRVFLTITGTPSGVETIEIKPSSAASVYDAAVNAMADTQTTGVKTLKDSAAPTHANATVTASDETSSSVKLSWDKAADTKTLEANLKYKVVYSTSDNIGDATNAASNGTAFGDWTANITTATVTGLTASKDYYFNVLVKDEADNITAYTSVTKKTAAAVSGGSSTTTSTVVEVNGKAQDAGTSSTTTTGGQTTTTIKVDDTKLDKLLESSGAAPTVTLPSTGSAVTVGELSGQTIKNMENKEATLEIKTENVTYTLPASQINIDNVSSQLGSQVALKDIKVSVSIAQPSADTVKIVENTASKGNYQLVVKPVEFTITCTSGNKTVDVSKFNGYVERTVAIPDGIDPSKITTGIVLNADGTFSHVPTSIVKIDGKYYAKISSLTNSTYSVIYNPVTFADVANHWAKTAINDMGSRMVVTGVGSSTYEPDRSITRAEFAAVVVRALGLKKGTTESAFGDVAMTDWFNGYVDTATEYSLITGYDSTSYGPNDTITREQAMAIIARAMKLTGLSVTLTDSEVSTLLVKYTDGATVSDYAKTSVAICLKSGVVAGSSATTLSPKAYVTRAEVAVMVQRMLQKAGLI